MNKNATYHILNGDALKHRFPQQIDGTILVLRECLVDGNITGTTLDEFYNTRANFLQKSYGVPNEDYLSKGVDEFNKIQNIPSGAHVYLWFEDDLFCQVNFWF